MDQLGVNCGQVGRDWGRWVTAAVPWQGAYSLRLLPPSLFSCCHEGSSFLLLGPCPMMHCFRGTEETLLLYVSKRHLSLSMPSCAIFSITLVWGHEYLVLCKVVLTPEIHTRCWWHQLSLTQCSPLHQLWSTHFTFTTLLICTITSHGRCCSFPHCIQEETETQMIK